MKKVYPKKPTELHIWNLLKSEKSLDGLIKRATPEVAEYIRVTAKSLQDGYQKCFDVCFLIFSQADQLKGKEREEFLKKYSDVRDVVENLLDPVEDVEYPALIWKKLKPSKLLNSEKR